VQQIMQPYAILAALGCSVQLSYLASFMISRPSLLSHYFFQFVFEICNSSTIALTVILILEGSLASAGVPVRWK
jgi:hypothetical protein